MRFRVEVEHLSEQKRRAYGLKSDLRERNARVTRRKLIDAARRLFSKSGFHDTSVLEIAKEAGLTQGALYHHFPDKTELFWAVSVELHSEILSAMTLDREAIKAEDVWKMFRSNITTFLKETVMRGDFQNIIVTDGPVVFGWQRQRELQETFLIRPVMMALDYAMQAKLIRARSSRPLALLILAALHEAAMMISHDNNDAALQVEVIGAVDDLLAGLSHSA